MKITNKNINTQIIGIGIIQVIKELKIKEDEPNIFMFNDSIKQSIENRDFVDWPTLLAGMIDSYRNVGYWRSKDIEALIVCK